jgi:hypothetical protein
MFTRTTFETSATQAIQVSRIDRWRIHQRLQELTIPCWCPEDGSLQVRVNTALTAVLVRSVVQQFVASRPELVSWLERCWQAKA